MDEWMLGKGIVDCLTRLGAEKGRAGYELLLIRILTRYQDLASLRNRKDIFAMFREMLLDDETRDFLGFNLYDEKWWFNKESMELFISWMSLAMILAGIAGKVPAEPAVKKALEDAFGAAQELLRVVSASGYEVSKLVLLLE